MTTEAEIVRLLEAHGPQTGAELQQHTRCEVRELWTKCRKSRGLRFEVAGRRYLRLDRSIPGYARLSPSIRREFQTYTVLGLESQADAVAERTRRMQQEFLDISRAKAELAESAIRESLAAVADAESILQQVCFILAGDITYGMAHAVPRPESSTGELVRGSDLDIVVIADDGFAPEAKQALDKAIYRQKYLLLVRPEHREEIDYLIKGLAKVREQMRFDSFEFMVACKILHEGEYLYGSHRLFDRVKALLTEHDIVGKLSEMERTAIARRADAEATLLDPPENLADREALTLFYTKEESEEIF